MSIKNSIIPSHFRKFVHVPLIIEIWTKIFHRPVPREQKYLRKLSLLFIKQIKQNDDNKNNNQQRHFPLGFFSGIVNEEMKK